MAVCITEGCENTDEDENFINGMCEECYEVDDTPTSDECDQCDNIATTCINGTNLCEDCEEHYHY